MEAKLHWENVYGTKKLDEVSWYQDIPTASLDLIRELDIAKESKIIDIGGGHSFLAENLLEKGYSNVSVLDISKNALDIAKNKLGLLANKIQWIENDVLTFLTSEKYDLWHDRAMFHFLTDKANIDKYKSTCIAATNDKAYLIVAAFSTEGPDKCSGLQTKKYNEEEIREVFEPEFELIKNFTLDHLTPMNSIQNFNFSVFRKK